MHMPDARRVAVVGASGFVGSAVCHALENDGAVVIRVRAPRLQPMEEGEALAAARSFPSVIDEMCRTIGSVDAVVNAAGLAEAGSGDRLQLMAANGALPGVLAAASARSGARFVHVSSAAVQGRIDTLDASNIRHPFSAYSASKAVGEEAAIRANPEAVIYRPPGVHAPDRRVTVALARVARSRLSAVAAPGTANTPQALLVNVAHAIAFLALCEQTPAKVVTHPSEGLSTADLMRLLGGKEPVRLPFGLARALAATVRAGGRLSPHVASNSRRLEMLWFGQGQDTSWLSEQGWVAPAGHQIWGDIGSSLRVRSTAKEKK